MPAYPGCPAKAAVKHVCLLSTFIKKCGRCAFTVESWHGSVLACMCACVPVGLSHCLVSQRDVYFMKSVGGRPRLDDRFFAGLFHRVSLSHCTLPSLVMFPVHWKFTSCVVWTFNRPTEHVFTCVSMYLIDPQILVSTTVHFVGIYKVFWSYAKLTTTTATFSGFCWPGLVLWH